MSQIPKEIFLLESTARICFYTGSRATLVSFQNISIENWRRDVAFIQCDVPGLALCYLILETSLYLSSVGDTRKGR